MKIGYFVGDFPYKDSLGDRDDYAKRYSRDGGITVAHNLAVNMAKRNNEVSVFTTSIYSKDFIEEYRNMTIYRYSTNFRIDHHNVSFSLFKKPIKHQVDLIHAHGGNFIAELAGLRYAKRKENPFILTYHGDAVETYGGIIRRFCVSFYIKHLLDRVLSYADVIISPSEYYINESRFLGKYRDKIVVIPNGINIVESDIVYSKEKCKEKLGLPLDGSIILFLGNLVPYKGPDVLVKAMSRIVKDVPDTKLFFVGKGVMRDELEMLSKKLGVEKNVKFTGFVEEGLKHFYYRAADVFVLPSTMSTESFGIVNLEAMACGVPIVASRIGGIPDVVKDGENGLLVPPRDSNALADAIIYLLENEEVRNKMGKNGRKKVEVYSWERIAEETEKVYLSLIEQKGT
jgi:glycosyltransferase involved in cell wall biosynthesis